MPFVMIHLRNVATIVVRLFGQNAVWVNSLFSFSFFYFHEVTGVAVCLYLRDVFHEGEWVCNNASSLRAATLHCCLHDASSRNCWMSAQVQRQEKTEGECWDDSRSSDVKKKTPTGYDVLFLIFLIVLNTGSYSHNNAGIQELFRWARQIYSKAVPTLKQPQKPRIDYTRQIDVSVALLLLSSSSWRHSFRFTLWDGRLRVRHGKQFDHWELRLLVFAGWMMAWQADALMLPTLCLHAFTRATQLQGITVGHETRRKTTDSMRFRIT